MILYSNSYWLSSMGGLLLNLQGTALFASILWLTPQKYCVEQYSNFCPFNCLQNNALIPGLRYAYRHFSAIYFLLPLCKSYPVIYSVRRQTIVGRCSEIYVCSVVIQIIVRLRCPCAVDSAAAHRFCT